jgi:uncharacterized protein with PIN domain
VASLHDQNDEPIFLCDAMLGGLARWLRAAGFDALFEYGIDDREIIRRAMASGDILLSSDGPMFERNIIKNAQVRALYIPQQLGKFEQLQFVLRHFGLPMRKTRCMACGGKLLEIPKHQVMDEVPPLAYRHCSQFFRCNRCAQLFWDGTHWRKITDKLKAFGGMTKD